MEFNPFLLYRKALKGPLEAQEVQWVREQAAKHPYFPLLHLINARIAGQEKSANKTKLEQFAAVFAADRHNLANYLSGNFPTSLAELTDDLLKDPEAKLSGNGSAQPREKKPLEQKLEPKAEPKAEPKPEPKKEEPKLKTPEPKVEPPKVEPPKEEPKKVTPPSKADDDKPVKLTAEEPETTDTPEAEETIERPNIDDIFAPPPTLKKPKLELNTLKKPEPEAETPKVIPTEKPEKPVKVAPDAELTLKPLTKPEVEDEELPATQEKPVAKEEPATKVKEQPEEKPKPKADKVEETPKKEEAKEVAEAKETEIEKEAEGSEPASEEPSDNEDTTKERIHVEAAHLTSNSGADAFNTYLQTLLQMRVGMYMPLFKRIEEEMAAHKAKLTSHEGSAIPKPDVTLKTLEESKPEETEEVAEQPEANEQAADDVPPPADDAEKPEVPQEPEATEMPKLKDFETKTEPSSEKLKANEPVGKNEPTPDGEHPAELPTEDEEPVYPSSDKPGTTLLPPDSQAEPTVTPEDELRKNLLSLIQKQISETKQKLDEELPVNKGEELPPVISPSTVTEPLPEVDPNAELDKLKASLTETLKEAPEAKAKTETTLPSSKEADEEDNSISRFVTPEFDTKPSTLYPEDHPRKKDAESREKERLEALKKHEAKKEKAEAPEAKTKEVEKSAEPQAEGEEKEGTGFTRRFTPLDPALSPLNKFVDAEGEEPQAKEKTEVPANKEEVAPEPPQAKLTEADNNERANKSRLDERVEAPKPKEETIEVVEEPKAEEKPIETPVVETKDEKQKEVSEPLSESKPEVDTKSNNTFDRFITPDFGSTGEPTKKPATEEKPKAEPVAETTREEKHEPITEVVEPPKQEVKEEPVADRKPVDTEGANSLKRFVDPGFGETQTPEPPKPKEELPVTQKKEEKEPEQEIELDGPIGEESMKRFVSPAFDTTVTVDTKLKEEKESSQEPFADLAPDAEKTFIYRHRNLKLEIVLKPDQVKFFKEDPRKLFAEAADEVLEAEREAQIAKGNEKALFSSKEQINLTDVEKAQQVLNPETYKQLEQALLNSGNNLTSDGGDSNDEAERNKLGQALELNQDDELLLSKEYLDSHTPVLENSEESANDPEQLHGSSGEFGHKTVIETKHGPKEITFMTPLPSEITLKSIQDKFLAKVISKMTGGELEGNDNGTVEPPQAEEAPTEKADEHYSVEELAKDDELPESPIDEVIEQYKKLEPKLGETEKEEPENSMEDISLEDKPTADTVEFPPSETLARIHEKQGNIDQAIEIYKKLQLKFPEKSDYFAAQIKALES